MSIYKKHVFVCTGGKKCPELGSQTVFDNLKEKIKELGLKKTIRINRAGCLDQCDSGPMVVVYPDGTWYCQVSKHDVDEIIEKDLIGDKPVKRLIYEP